MLTLVGILIQLIDQALCWFRLARVFGLVDSAVRVASAIHSANVDSSLQCWTSAHGAGPGCSRSSARLSRLPTTPIAPSPRRVLHDPRQVDPWRSAPRVLHCARRSVTQYLRTTMVLRYGHLAPDHLSKAAELVAQKRHTGSRGKVSKRAQPIDFTGGERGTRTLVLGIRRAVNQQMILVDS